MIKHFWAGCIMNIVGQQLQLSSLSLQKSKAIALSKILTILQINTQQIMKMLNMDQIQVKKELKKPVFLKQIPLQHRMKDHMHWGTCSYVLQKWHQIKNISTSCIIFLRERATQIKLSMVSPLSQNYWDFFKTIMLSIWKQISEKPENGIKISGG